MGGLDIAERRAPQDGRVSIKRDGESIDVRIAILPTTHGEKVTLRILSQGEAPDSLDALGMWPRSRAALERAISQPFGAVVVVGPTGSGKTTTLYTCLQVLNTPDRQLTTIEDPVEYRAAGLDQIEVNPRAGLSFANGLRTVLRSDPDVLLVGEVRDEETAQIAFRAAMTGHLVLTTLHAQTAASAIQRLTDMNIEPSILATSINCIIGQRLARRVCQTCCEAAAPDPSMMEALRVPQTFGDLNLYKAVGCDECGGTGYRGRVPLFEVLSMTDEIAFLIGAPTREIEAMAISQGMFTLREDGCGLPSRGSRRWKKCVESPATQSKLSLKTSSTLHPMTVVELDDRELASRVFRRTRRLMSTSSATSMISSGITRGGSGGIPAVAWIDVVPPLHGARMSRCSSQLPTRRAPPCPISF